MSVTKTMHLRYPEKQPITEVADYILEEKSALPERVRTFELIEGPASAMGSGDQAIVEIVIRYDEADADTVADIKQIIAFANRGASEVIVEINDVDDS